jgi:hypothetical protein
LHWLARTTTQWHRLETAQIMAIAIIPVAVSVHHRVVDFDGAGADVALVDLRPYSWRARSSAASPA